MHLRAIVATAVVALFACDSAPDEQPAEHQLVFDLGWAPLGNADTLVTHLTVDGELRVEVVDLTGPSWQITCPCEPGATVTWSLDVVDLLADGESLDVAPVHVQDTTICNEVVTTTVIPIELTLMKISRQGFFDVEVRFDGAGAAGAVLDIRVDARDEVMWDMTVGSLQFGDGPHRVSYVGPCDATASPNTVTVTLETLVDASEAPLDFIALPVLTIAAPCHENRDLDVKDFDLTVARWVSDTPADGVRIGASRCRPSIACADGVTALELACDLDPAAPEYADHPAAVLLDDLSLTCGAMTIALGPLGDAGAQAPGLFDVARPEPLDGDGFGWRYALALTDSAGSCTVSARATIARDALADGEQPALTVLPAFTWRADLDDTGACTPADLGDDGAVGFQYAGPDAHVWPTAIPVDLDE